MGRNKPTKEQIEEAIYPALTKDIFKIGDKEFKIQVLPIAVEKRFTHSIQELIGKLGIADTTTLQDMLVDNIGTKLSSVADLLIDMVYVIILNQDKTISKEYIENNAYAKQLFDIVIGQLHKQELLELIVGFIKGMGTK